MADSLSESAEKAADAVADGLAAARDKFQSLNDDMQKRYRQVSKDVRRGAERAGKDLRRNADAARAAYRDTADKVEKHYRKAHKEAKRIGRDVSEYVRDNPGKSVLIAAGVGFLLGLVIRRRDDD
jgi:ElaB/YqjD/DUF883 family membrane-anchored ribosome-binding protein